PDVQHACTSQGFTKMCDDGFIYDGEPFDAWKKALQDNHSVPATEIWRGEDQTFWRVMDNKDFSLDGEKVPFRCSLEHDKDCIRHVKEQTCKECGDKDPWDSGTHDHMG
ncbi:MAG: hypothetical protein MMC23_005049, partial [Stictis urceolatum]|nr:hypothetical protein [Stictis urceolata]